jgi:thymidine kinase
MLPEKDEKAYLELILGPMFAGKTSQLIEIHNHCQMRNISVYVINHSLDKRYSEDQLTTHNSLSIPATNTDVLCNLLTSEREKKCIMTSSVILINEGQFFDDLKEFVVELVEKHNKKVYVCGLDGDFKRNKFGQILDLIPYADNIVKLKAICKSCNSYNAAIFTSRTCGEKLDQLIIGGTDIYEPVCRECYLKKES